MSRLVLSLLGPFQARVGERAVVHFATDKARALLAYLAVEADRPHRRDTLAALLWPEWDDVGARSNLRLALHRLRESLDSTEPTLSDGIFGVTRETVQINRTAVDVDVARFVALLEMCELHPHRLLHLCPSCLAQLDEAAALYEGELLAGLSIGDAPGFEQWELARRAEMEQRVLTLFYRLADAFEQLGDYERGLFFAHRQLAIDPYREEAHRQVMRLYARQGKRAAALAHYEYLRQLLAGELGVEPDAMTLRLAEEIRVGRLTGAPLVGRPLLYHFPAYLTPFFGRAAEIAALAELCRAPSAQGLRATQRLTTIIAPGGMGKTRLAVAAAEAVAEWPGFPDGITFLSLARTAAADLLPSALATALGVNLSSAAEPADQLAAYLRPKTALLVLDNMEHLLDGAAFLVQLLEAAPGLKLLVTSREALNVRGEERFMLGALDDASIAQLFISAAARLQPGYDPDATERAAITAIGRVVGGMPLAVELAATWVRLMDAPAIADQVRHNLDFLTSTLRDLPPRQRSMRAIFDQAWATLSPPETRAMAALSVLRGPFRLDAAEGISEASPFVLAQLIDGTLLHAVGGGRFEMHELLRQYAAQHLAAEPEQAAAAAERHAGHYLALLAERGAALGRAESKSALASLQRNSDNVRAAWAWAIDNGRLATIEAAARPLDTFYRFSGLLAEGVEALAAAAAVLEARIARGDLDPVAGYPVIYDLWRREAKLRELRGDRTTALLLLERVRDGWLSLGDRRRLSLALSDLSFANIWQARFKVAGDLAESALALGREIGDDQAIAAALNNLGNSTTIAGDLSRAESLFRESVARYRLTNGRGLVGTLGNLGRILANKGDLNAAHEVYLEALAIAETTGDQPGVVMVLTSLGGIALYGGNLAAAEAYSRRSQIGAQEIGDPIMLSYSLGVLGHIARERGQQEARRLYHDALALSLEITPATPIEPLIGLASLASDAEPARAAHWLAAIEAWRKTFLLVDDPDAGDDPYVRALRLGAEGQSRAALGEAAFAAAWAEGQTLSLETASAQALVWAIEPEHPTF